MDPYKIVLDKFEGLYGKLALTEKNSDQRYDQREQIWEDVNKLTWLTSYISLMDDLRGFDESQHNKLDPCKEIYISCEEFPTVGRLSDWKKIDNLTKYNIFYRYTGNYGSSSVCLFRRLNPIKGDQITDDILDRDTEIKNFVEFFTQLGKEVCMVFEHTYDSMNEIKLGQYEINDGLPLIKLCVCSNIKPIDL